MAEPSKAPPTGRALVKSLPRRSSAVPLLALNTGYALQIVFRLFYPLPHQGKSTP